MAKKLFELLVVEGQLKFAGKFRDVLAEGQRLAVQP